MRKLASAVSREKTNYGGGRAVLGAEMLSFRHVIAVSWASNKFATLPESSYAGEIQAYFYGRAMARMLKGQSAGLTPGNIGGAEYLFYAFRVFRFLLDFWGFLRLRICPVVFYCNLGRVSPFRLLFAPVCLS